MALADVMEGWKGEGKIGDNCPKVVMAIPFAVIDHRPVLCKGYFCSLGERVPQTRSEILKSDPEVSLYGPLECGNLGCKAAFFLIFRLL